MRRISHPALSANAFWEIVGRRQSRGIPHRQAVVLKREAGHQTIKDPLHITRIFMLLVRKIRHGKLLQWLQQWMLVISLIGLVG